MGIGIDEAYLYIASKERFVQRLDELRHLLAGDDASISGIVGAGEAFSEEKARLLADEAVEAHDAFAAASLGWDEDRLGAALPEDLRAERNGFLSSLLYCMLRLVAESPWFDGRYDTWANACLRLLDEFGNDYAVEHFLAGPLEAALVYCAGVPRLATPESVVARFGDDEDYRRFPLSECTGVREERAYFISELDMVYEMLSGKPVVETFSEEECESLKARAEMFPHLAIDGVLLNMSDDEAGRAFELGWIGEDDLSRRAALLADGPGEVVEEEQPQPWQEGEAARIREWVRRFPAKDEWCARYLEMRRAYFEIGGAFDVIGIDTEWMEDAFGLVLDARGFSHYGDNVAYDRLARTIDGIRRGGGGAGRGRRA